MCGRLNVIDDPFMQALAVHLNIKLYPKTNMDLRPTQQVTVVTPEGVIETKWGIKPHWSKSLLINAQAEKLTTSKVWRPAFEHQRCLVPCSGYYEWRTEEDNKKHKYLFTGPNNEALLMAALYWPAGVYDGETTIVTLTTTPNHYTAQYHHRMPVIIPTENADWWLNGNPEDLGPLLTPLPEKAIIATAA